MNKSVVYIGATIGGVAGSFLGSFLDHGNYFGFWGIFLSLVGGLAGIWAAFKLQQ